MESMHAIERINQALPEGVHFDAFYDQADLITQAVQTVVNALLLAFVFIVVILALFPDESSCNFSGVDFNPNIHWYRLNDYVLVWSIKPT